MRVNLRVSFALGAFLLLGGTGRAQKKTHDVRLSVVLNGQPARPPAKLLVSNGTRSMTLPARAGHIIVPAEMATGSLTIQARIGPDLIKVSGMPPYALESSWTIILADESFGEDYDYIIPKGTDVRSMCIVEFEPEDAEGIGMSVANCRKPVGKRGAATK